MEPLQEITTRLPPIGVFHVNSSVPREPPERSWAKFKHVLIDNPRDENLLHRQKLWNFQQSNRGAFRSKVRSLPDIPYRYDKSKQTKISIGTQSEVLKSETERSLRNRLLFPRIGHAYSEENLTRNQFSGVRILSPTPREINQSKSLEFDANNNDLDNECFEGDNEAEDGEIGYTSVKRKVDAGTMTDAQKPMPKKKQIKTRKKVVTKVETIAPPAEKRILKSPDSDIDKENPKKNVKFKDVEVEQGQESEELERVPTADSSISNVSTGSGDINVENVGPSSQRTLDPLSVLDFLSGHRIGNSRTLSLDPDKKKKPKSENVFREKRKSKVPEISDSEADRIWFEKVIGDKTVVDLGTYANFARTKPSGDSPSDSNDNKTGDKSKAASYTPRIHGEYRLSKTSPNGKTKYFPLFTTDGAPIRKYGGTPPKNRDPKLSKTS